MNRFNQFVFRDRPFSIIDHDSIDIHLSLESSLQSLLDEIDQLDHYIQQAKQLCRKTSENNLTIDESAAIYLYSYEWTEKSLQYFLNQALQSGDPMKMKPWLNFWDLFNTALRKLPTIQQTVWRGLPKELVTTLYSSNDIVCWSVTSCCISENIMKSMLHSDSILCSIETLRGKDIRGYTCDSNDEEVLLLPGTQLRLGDQLSTADYLFFEEISVINPDIRSNENSSIISLSNPTNSDHNRDFNSYRVRRSVSTKQYQRERSFSSTGTTDSKIFSTITFANGDQYLVIHEHDRKLGSGRYTSFIGDTYTAEDADQRANGDGICVFPNGNRFIGTFQQGLRFGHGIRYHTDGTIIVGRWFNDAMVETYLHVRNSTGQYEWKDPTNNDRCYGAYHDDQGNKYIGGMIDSRAIGLGIRIWPDNSRYEGSFKNDKKDGYGIYYYTDRDKYMGQWQSNEIHGQGILKWQSGSMYQGSFVNGKRHGQGSLILADRQIRRGHWKNDMYMA